jgi:hypothetical protein
MSFMLWELAKHQEVQAHLRRVIKSARAANNGGPLTAHDLENIPYLNAVVKVRRNCRFVHLDTNRSFHRSSSVSIHLYIMSCAGPERRTFCHSMNPLRPSPEP